MRLIDADKLRKDIQFVLDTLGEPTQYGLRQAMSIIDRTPTEVVFCKDCKYSSPNGKYGCRLEHFEFENAYVGRLVPVNGVRMYTEDFCSRGVRRGEEDE